MATQRGTVAAIGGMMDPRLGHLLALLLGITLTVSFYEGRRLVFNTMKAVQAANAELRGSGGGGGGKKTEKKKGKKKAAKGDAEAPSADGARKGGGKKGASKKGGSKKGGSKKEAVRERLRTKLAEMSPEEREALKSRVQERRDARKLDLQARREALRERRQDRMAELGLTLDGDLPPEEDFEDDFADFEDDFDPDAPVAEDELLDALEEDLPPLEDTGLPVE